MLHPRQCQHFAARTNIFMQSYVCSFKRTHSLTIHEVLCKGDNNITHQPEQQMFPLDGAVYMIRNCPEIC